MMITDQNFFYIFVIIWEIILQSVSADLIKIRIENGEIAGRKFLSVQNNTIYSFQQIPYAQPPVGPLRFKEPLPSKNWTGVLETTNNTKICWEARFDYSRDDPRQNEDCLYLNVYSPRHPNSESELLPVYVYIYGGNFLFGQASLDYIDPQFLVDSGVIAVTLNYRSGPLGFLTTEDGVIPGNLALKDQNLALKWVQTNIRYFGGDASKVVLGGHSSGAICVAHHLLSSRSSGLFRAVIIQSGAAIGPLSRTKRARFHAIEMGKLFSSSFSASNTSRDLLNLLLKVPARNLTYAQFPHIQFKDNILEERSSPLKWRPVIERVDSPNAYVTELAYQNLLTGNLQKVPLMIGITSEEMIGMTPFLSQSGSFIDKHTIFYETNNIKWGLRKHLEGEIKKIYTNTTFEDDLVASIRYFGDYIVSIPTILQAVFHSQFADTYFYQFSYFGQMNYLKLKDKDRIINVPGLGNVGHAEELPYILCYPGKCADMHTYPESDRQIQKKMVKLWTNFVKYLNPTPCKKILFDKKKWPKISKTNFSYFNINSTISVIEEFPRPYESWKPLIDTYLMFPLDTL